MGDPFQKVQRGDRLRIPAETFNTFIDAAKDFRSRTQNRSRTTQPEFPQAGIILVKNDTVGDLDRFHVLGISRPIFSPAESLFSFQDQLAIVGVTPIEEDHLGRFLILQEPLRSGMCSVPLSVRRPLPRVVPRANRSGRRSEAQRRPSTGPTAPRQSAGSVDPRQRVRLRPAAGGGAAGAGVLPSDRRSLVRRPVLPGTAGPLAPQDRLDLRVPTPA